jgi:hypothetical protein
MKSAMILIMTLLVLSAGCLHKTQLIKHPDSPMLIQKVKGTKVLVALYSKGDNTMLKYGWVRVPEGWTLHKYDWEKYIEEHR